MNLCSPNLYPSSIKNLWIWALDAFEQGSHDFIIIAALHQLDIRNQRYDIIA